LGPEEDDAIFLSVVIEDCAMVLSRCVSRELKFASKGRVEMDDTIPKLMQTFVGDEPDLTVQWSKDNSGVFRPIVWKQLYVEVQAFAAGLLSLGVKRGDHIGMISDNMKEWFWADLAILSIGAADVPRGSDSTVPEIQYILDHAECGITIAENESQLEKILSIKQSVKGQRNPGARPGVSEEKSRVYWGGDRQRQDRGPGHDYLYIGHYRRAQRGDADPQQLHAPNPDASQAYRY
jgi:long-subunit acyl-CoA synthetase (AMP-forming)